ncbi:MAG TPA: adenine phosphoribosyltransferase [Ornithinimicrobium sp.]|uniref:adenine phosphoribosyltransferase n=1 Tax=Ornithinimicrobium sp. TaxID=1977084 RepID=UPI002B469E26|nr:adenine phosphoribosyltransferase [Ornithinimicrobium sp.]HKJ11783.1 adenine phosphoribosyltransferase [Ornithinimicrobium sp.]
MSSLSDPHPDQRRDELAREVSQVLRDVPDFPEPGIVFKDFTPLLADPGLSARVVDDLAGRHRGEIDIVAGIEARGFVFGAATAYALAVPFVPIRKAGKLPSATYRVDYDLEYGSATLEMHTDAVRPGQRVLLVDDVLATGGTAAATVELLRRAQAHVSAVEVILELGFLSGREAVPDVMVRSLLST